LIFGHFEQGDVSTQKTGKREEKLATEPQRPQREGGAMDCPWNAECNVWVMVLVMVIRIFFFLKNP
jgi:hypothetical protein